MRKKLFVPTILLLTLFAAVPSKTLAVEAAIITESKLPKQIVNTRVSDATLNTYYSSLQGKKGEEILQQLYNLTKDKDELRYSNSYVYKIIDRNWELDKDDNESPANLDNFDYANDNGYIRKLYADYNDSVDTANRFTKDGLTDVSFDKEHIWAQSLGEFGRDLGAGSDLHALWAADASINRHAHSNYNYAEPEKNIRDRENDQGRYGGRNGDLNSGGDKVFEPLDQYKGDIARAMFYMPARYYEYIDEKHPKLELVYGNPSAVVASETVTGKADDLETLLRWHEEDPVDEFEINRNNLIYHNYQHNRNPFIDYPQLARLVYDPDYANEAFTVPLGQSSVGDGYDPYDGMVLESISIDTSRVKTNYLLGEAFTSTNLSVTAHFMKNGETISQPVSNYATDTINGTKLLEPGTKTIIVSFMQGTVKKDASFTITVSSESLENFLYISEVYGGGGNAGASYTHDFIELYNYADFAISLHGLSVQYSPGKATTVNWSPTSLVGVIPAKSYYLIQLASYANVGAGLPMSNITNTTQMSASDIIVALVNGTTKLDKINPHEDDHDPLVIDLVGTKGANAFLNAEASKPSATKSLQRKFILEGTTPPITKNNSEDYVLDTPTPYNSAHGIALEILKGDTEMQCIVRYPVFKSRVLDLSEDVVDEFTGEVISTGVLSYFKTTDDAIIRPGRDRYEAWALAVGDDKPYEYVPLDSSATKDYINNNDNRVIYIAIIAFFSIGLYTLMKLPQRKETSK